MLVGVDLCCSRVGSGSSPPVRAASSSLASTASRAPSWASASSPTMVRQALRAGIAAMRGSQVRRYAYLVRIPTKSAVDSDRSQPVIPTKLSRSTALVELRPSVTREVPPRRHSHVLRLGYGASASCRSARAAPHSDASDPPPPNVRDCGKLPRDCHCDAPRAPCRKSRAHSAVPRPGRRNSRRSAIPPEKATPEMVKPVLEQDPGDGHPELSGIGENRRTLLSGRMTPPRLSPPRTDSEHPRAHSLP